MTMFINLRKRREVMVLQTGNVGVLALGNILRQDEGVGIHLLSKLRGRLPENVELLDGGTSGLELLSFLERKERLIVLDAVDDGAEPGEIIEWSEKEIPKYTSGKLSVHQMSFAEVLYWSHFIGAIPDEIIVIGIQPQSLNWGTGLTETVQRSLLEALEKVLNHLQRWGAVNGLVEFGEPLEPLLLYERQNFEYFQAE